MNDPDVTAPQTNETVIAKLARMEHYAIAAVSHLESPATVWGVDRAVVCCFATLRASVRDQRFARLVEEVKHTQRGGSDGEKVQR